jgi:hypothetical protein
MLFGAVNLSFSPLDQLAKIMTNTYLHVLVGEIFARQKQVITVFM